jgi:hypothetical protein
MFSMAWTRSSATPDSIPSWSVEHPDKLRAALNTTGASGGARMRAAVARANHLRRAPASSGSYAAPAPQRGCHCSRLKSGAMEGLRLRGPRETRRHLTALICSSRCASTLGHASS